MDYLINVTQLFVTQQQPLVLVNQPLFLAP
jgi:hypothetical protein